MVILDGDTGYVANAVDPAVPFPKVVDYRLNDSLLHGMFCKHRGIALFDGILVSKDIIYFILMILRTIVVFNNQ